ncbi:MAG: response regulator [Candidatus Schekmanbacteria bacterium]|nr:response regulator [Candidatus Schekmanbacteria bacterium]
MKILVLDDDPVILSLTSDLLLDEGYEITPVNNPSGALESLKTAGFDLLITDIKMPKMTGLDVIKQMRQFSPKTKAIIMTGFGNIETAQTAIKEGAYDYILKPFNNDTLRLAVKNAIKRKELEEENNRLKELTGLFQFSELISSRFSTQSLYELILSSILKQLHVSQGSIMLLDEKAKTLKIAAAVGLDEDVTQKPVALNECIAGKVIQGGKPVLVSNIDAHPLFCKLARDYPDKSFISASMGIDDELISLPLSTSKHTIGVINLRKKINGMPFNQADLELLSILAVQAAIAIDNNRLLSDLNGIYLGIMQFMVALTEARDVYLRGHTHRVTSVCLRLGHAIGLGKQELNNLKYGAVLHDIGKLAISENILNKPGKLTPEEYEVIKTHPAIGANILKPFKFLDEARQIVLHHHERYDGKGYPNGISGAALSPSNQVIIIADSYDAMSSDRAYRKALSSEEINQEFTKNKGSQFHPQLVDFFLRLLNKEPQNATPIRL